MSVTFTKLISLWLTVCRVCFHLYVWKREGLNDFCTYPGRTVCGTDYSARTFACWIPVWISNLMDTGQGYPCRRPNPRTIDMEIHTNILTDIRVKLSELRTVRPGYIPLLFKRKTMEIYVSRADNLVRPNYQFASLLNFFIYMHFKLMAPPLFDGPLS